MMHFTRPAKPPEFEEAMTRVRQRVRDAIAAGETPDFPAKWSRYKPAFVEAQHGKCAFCEAKVLVTGRGDVEHYRPKGEVHELPVNPRSLGVQIAHASTPKGRLKGACVAILGYWWLAYDWDNWLFACTCCNQDWKQTFLPMADRPRITVVEHCEHGENPLLLHPYGGPDPVKHLAFTRDGMISARDASPWGDATIDTCGLALRPELLQGRAAVAQKVFALLDRAVNARTEQQRSQLLDELEEYCDPSAAHAGMARSIVEVYFGEDCSEKYNS